MTHFKVSDDAHSHPKVILAGDAAFGMWNRAGCFAMAYGTDGFVPDWWVKQQPQGATKARRLVSAELWHRGEYHGRRPEFQGQKGYNFHQWRQDSYEKVEADRKKWRDKKAAQRGSSPALSPGDNEGDSPGDSPREPNSVETLKSAQKRPSNIRRYKAENQTPRNASARADAQMSPGDSRESPGYIPNTHISNSGYVPESATDPNAQRGVAATTGAELLTRATPPGLHVPSPTQTGLRLAASELVNTGTPPDVVIEAIREWFTKTGIGPGVLASLAADVAKRRNGHARAAPAAGGLTAGEQKVVGWAALGNANPNQQRAIE